MRKRKRRTSVVFLLLILAAGNSFCFAASRKPGIDSIKTYTQIPGVTSAEKNAIEALKSLRKSFSFGSIPSTEAFILDSGRYAGFSTLLCDLLSGLFGIPFVQEFHGWDELISMLDSEKIDFNGELTPTAERKKTYFMTHPIAERSLGVFTYVPAKTIENESDLQGRRIGFYIGSITAGSIHNVYPNLNFEEFYFKDAPEAAKALEDGSIDAFIIDAVESYKFTDYPFIRFAEILPLVYTPVSITAKRSELEPVISVVNKYLEAGGIDKLYELYKIGSAEYARYTFNRDITAEERAYLDGLTASGRKVPVALENDNYPISFYNEKEGQFQGIAPDYMAEISKLTGIEFETVTGRNTSWLEIMEKIKTGEISMVSELKYTEERSAIFLFSDPYFSSRYALLSKTSYPKLEMYQVVRAKVGAGEGSAFEELYNRWFPGNANLRLFDSQNDAIKALEDGKIDLYMGSENTLLVIRNYMEKPGFKANIIFASPVHESLFGFNKNEELLHSIICKAQRYIDSSEIEEEWVNQVFDYSRRIANDRLEYFSITALVLFLSLILLASLYISNNRTKDSYKEKMLTLSTIYRAIPDLVYSMDENLRFTSSNRKHEEFTGFSESEVLGKTDIEIYANSPDQELVKGIMDINKKVITEKIAITVEEIHNRPDNSKVFLKSTKIPLIQNGRIIGLVGISRDITEYQQAINAVKEKMLTLSAVYKSIPDQVYSMDKDLKFTSCNYKYEEFHGLTESEILGKTDLEIYADAPDPELRKMIMEVNESVIKDRKTITVEETHIRPGKKSILMRSTKTPLIQDDTVIGLLGITTDITEYREALNAANESSRAKSSFLARMSHEIRTPMNAIIGMAELALRENKLSAAHRHIRTVKQAGAYLLSIINDILDFSKIEVGKLEIFEEEYLVSSLINDVISIIRMRVIDSHVKFVVNIDSNIPASLIGDETRIRQVLLNLLNNAVKYTDKGFVSFSARGEIIDEERINLVMEVKDSGRGIKQEDVEKLFGEYMQMDQEKNKGIEGVGLGLAITWNIIKAMGGDIKVSSEYGKGSIFTATIPQKALSSKPLASVKDPGKMNVIVYERRETFANSIAFTINNLGVACTLVSANTELRDELAAGEYSFIFISLSLYKENKEMIMELGKTAKVVLLAEFGEAVPDKKLSTLAMPVYSISVANILNGVSESFNLSENDENIGRFIAPDAKVLIVDDVNTNLKVAQGLMMPYKMHIDLCRNGQEAIQAVKEKRYDLVFMDHKMPVMDGAETTARIREMGNEDPYYKNVPIIALTANAVSGVREFFLNSGFNDYLSKPIDTIKLNIILEKWMPKEKKKKSSASADEISWEANYEAFEKINIEGLNAEKGIFFSGGTMESYMETLELFRKDGVEKIREIKDSLEKNDLELFTVHVHALKSASANIGADALSEMAAMLELAGERNDKEYIESHTPELFAALEKINGSILDVLASDEDDGEDNFCDMEELRNELTILKEALGAFDAGTINRTVESLLNMARTGGMKANVQLISEKILVGEYEEAMAIVEVLLEEGE